MQQYFLSEVKRKSKNSWIRSCKINQSVPMTKTEEVKAVITRFIFTTGNRCSRHMSTPGKRVIISYLRCHSGESPMASLRYGMTGESCPYQVPLMNKANQLTVRVFDLSTIFVYTYRFIQNRTNSLTT